MASVSFLFLRYFIVCISVLSALWVKWDRNHWAVHQKVWGFVNSLSLLSTQAPHPPTRVAGNFLPEQCYLDGRANMGKGNLLLPASSIVVLGFVSGILGYCNFLTVFWTSHKGILVYKLLLNWCFCGRNTGWVLTMLIRFYHFADVTRGMLF